MNRRLRKEKILILITGTLLLTPSCLAQFSPDRSPLASPPSMVSNVSSLSELTQIVHNQVNQYRRSQNLPPLTLDARISEQCRIHSENMAKGQVEFSHNGFENRAKALESQIPYRAVAENVGYNLGYREPAIQVVEGWIKSQGHRQNIEGNYDLTGIGVAKNAKGEYYFTQIFIRRR